jgi:hypothetical protein
VAGETDMPQTEAVDQCKIWEGRRWSIQSTFWVAWPVLEVGSVFKNGTEKKLFKPRDSHFWSVSLLFR